MAGPEEQAAQAAQAARVAEEASMRDRANRNRNNGQGNGQTRGGSGRTRRSRSTDNPGNFNERTTARRQANTMYKDRSAAYEDIMSQVEKRDNYAERLRYYKSIYDMEIDDSSVWYGPGGQEVQLTYQELCDGLLTRATTEEDRRGVQAIRRSLDSEPSAIRKARRGGFGFINETDIRNISRGKSDEAELKAAKMRFLHNTIQSYNDGTYQPYYNRSAAYEAILLNDDDPDFTFTGSFSHPVNLDASNRAFVKLSRQYGVDPDTIKSWYEQADRVILSYERDRVLDPDELITIRDPETKDVLKYDIRRKKIDVDYKSLFDFSRLTSNMQYAMNQRNPEGVYSSNAFDTVSASADSAYNRRTAYREMKYLSQKIDECNKKIDDLKKERSEYTETLDKTYDEPFRIGGGLQAMYDAEMNRYRDGFVQQAPLMIDMVKRYGREKTRFFDGRHEAKEQLREQKWSQKTGINDRGIKTDNFFDFFKSLVNECRRSLAVSGVTDFSLIGDTDRLLLALGIDAAENSFNRMKYNIEKKRDAMEEEELNRAVDRSEADYESMFSDREEGFDTSNYTKSLQIVSEAESGVKYNGEEAAAADYDGRDNNPADVMAGRDDNNEVRKDVKQQERNLQNLIDEKGHNTKDPDDPENDGHDGPDMD